jgi:magnesium-transporting ATPase (P-type)
MGLIILNIKSLLGDFSKTFYTEPIMILLNILFLILALKFNVRDKKYRIFILYGVAALLQDMVNIGVSLTKYTDLETGKLGVRLIDIAVIVFIQIEFIVFYTFFYWQFEGKQMQKNIKIGGYSIIFLSMLCSLNCIFFMPNNTMHVFLSYFSVSFSVLQLLPAFYYFYILFNDPPVKNLLREPSFWITTGIAFLHGLNIPLFWVDNYVMQLFSPIWLPLYSINIIAYCFLFVLFIISLLCDKPIKGDILHIKSGVV